MRENVRASCTWSSAEKSSVECVLGGVHLDSLSDGGSVEVVNEKSVVVGEELTAEDGLIVSCDVGIQVGDKKTASARPCGVSELGSES